MKPSHTKHFQGCWAPAELFEKLRDKKITATEFTLLLVINGFVALRGDDCFASNEYLAQEIGMSEAWIKDIIPSLIKRGFLIKTRSDGRRRFLRTLWARPIVQQTEQTEQSTPVPEQNPNELRVRVYPNSDFGCTRTYNDEVMRGTAGATRRRLSSEEVMKLNRKEEARNSSGSAFRGLAGALITQFKEEYRRHLKVSMQQTGQHMKRMKDLLGLVSADEARELIHSYFSHYKSGERFFSTPTLSHFLSSTVVDILRAERAKSRRSPLKVKKIPGTMTEEEWHKRSGW